MLKNEDEVTAIESVKQQEHWEDNTKSEPAWCGCCSGSVAPEGAEEEQGEEGGKKEKHCIYTLSTHPYFERTFIVAILMNTLVLMMEYEGMSTAYADVLTIFSLLLSQSCLLITRFHVSHVVLRVACGRAWR